jgi:hypothetical protein
VYGSNDRCLFSRLWHPQKKQAGSDEAFFEKSNDYNNMNFAKPCCDKGVENFFYYLNER